MISERPGSADRSLRESARCPRSGAVGALSVLAFITVVAAPLAAQAPTDAVPGSPVDTTGIALTPRLHTLFEVTIFQVDVLTLEVRFGRQTASRLAALADGADDPDAIADSVLALALDADDAWARMEFQRDFGFDRFQDGMTSSIRAAVKAGIVTPATYDSIASSIPEWYGFLSERGVRDGDEIFYRVRGDTLRTVFRGVDGRVLLDQVNVGPDRGRGLLGGWFAPEADFREGLVKSLVEDSR